MAEKRPKQLSTKARAELYRQFLEDDAQSLRIIVRHAGQSLFLRARPDADAKGQGALLLRALNETYQRHNGNAPAMLVAEGGERQEAHATRRSKPWIRKGREYAKRWHGEHL